MQTTPTIFVVDDDPGVSRALQSVGQLLELPVVSCTSAEEFLACYDPAQPGCLVLDIKMPGMTGLELQQRMAEFQPALPIIMISGHANVRIAVEAMKRGATTLLEKPFPLDDLMTYVREAIEQDSANRAALQKQAESESQFAQLTDKEREVFDLVTAGNTNKQIAASLHISIRAVEDRRARLMRKLGVRSVAELVQLR